MHSGVFFTPYMEADINLTLAMVGAAFIFLTVLVTEIFLQECFPFILITRIEQWFTWHASFLCGHIWCPRETAMKMTGRCDYTLKNSRLTADSVSVHSFTVCWCLPSLTRAFIALLTLWPTDPGRLTLNEPKMLSHTCWEDPTSSKDPESHRYKASIWLLDCCFLA